MGNSVIKKRTPEFLDKEIAILQANTNFTEQQLRSLYQDFIQKFPAGRMKRKEFIQYYIKFADPQKRTKEMVDFLFTVFDKNSDESVDFSEFVLACGMVGKKDMNNGLELAFNMLDRSGDGYITYEEMMNFTETAKKFEHNESFEDLASETVATAVFDIFDLNKEQKLSKEQFINGYC